MWSRSDPANRHPHPAPGPTTPRKPRTGRGAFSNVQPNSSSPGMTYSTQRRPWTIPIPISPHLETSPMPHDSPPHTLPYTKRLKRTPEQTRTFSHTNCIEHDLKLPKSIALSFAASPPHISKSPSEKNNQKHQKESNSSPQSIPRRHFYRLSLLGLRAMLLGTPSSLSCFS